MKRKILCSAAFGIMLASSAYCTGLKALFVPEYSVSVKESESEILEKVESYNDSLTYLKKFRYEDKMGKRHQVTIYDENYLSIDNVVYAYKFRNAMYYSLVIRHPNGAKIVDGTDKMIGLQCNASPINNPDTTISFIFARKLFAQKGYSSMAEASRIDGVYFAAPSIDDGYIDDFGRWQRYTWWDLFEGVFLTRNQNVRTELYGAVQLMK